MREALFPSVGQENPMSVRPSVRPSVRIIITFCELNLGGGTHAAGPWWFELWILEGRKRTLHLFALATGISRFRDPFLDTVSDRQPDARCFRPETCEIRCCECGPSLRAPAAHGVSSIFICSCF